jgi:hypothetical protein
MIRRHYHYSPFLSNIYQAIHGVQYNNVLAENLQLFRMEVIRTFLLERTKL